jgi:hypothetical protein
LSQRGSIFSFLVFIFFNLSSSSLCSSRTIQFSRASVLNFRLAHLDERLKGTESTIISYIYWAISISNSPNGRISNSHYHCYIHHQRTINFISLLLANQNLHSDHKEHLQSLRAWKSILASCFFSLKLHLLWCLNFQIHHNQRFQRTHYLFDIQMMFS